MININKKSKNKNPKKMITHKTELNIITYISRPSQDITIENKANMGA